MKFIHYGNENTAVEMATGENIRQIKKYLVKSLSNYKINKTNILFQVF
jgi:hypothetical protein